MGLSLIYIDDFSLLSRLFIYMVRVSLLLIKEPFTAKLKLPKFKPIYQYHPNLNFKDQSYRIRCNINDLFCMYFFPSIADRKYLTQQIIWFYHRKRAKQWSRTVWSQRVWRCEHDWARILTSKSICPLGQPWIEETDIFIEFRMSDPLETMGCFQYFDSSPKWACSIVVPHFDR